MMQVGAESASALLGWALLSSYKGPNWQSKLGHIYIYIGTYIITVRFFQKLFRKIIISDFPYKTSIWHTLNP